MKIAIIGLGLIGGSLALSLKDEHQLFGIDTNKKHQQKAKELGLVSALILLEDIKNMDAVIIAVPVDIAPIVTIKVLDLIADDTLVFDVGSTKEPICKAIKNHPKRNHFVAMHPIAGTEFSGPEAAVENLFTGKVTIICEQELTANNQLQKIKKLIAKLKMRLVFIDNAKQHDKHIAYVSHLSHISSFMLGKTVLEIEKGEKNIFDMAGSGFESTVRLAKSSPKTWTPIFIQNKKHIIKSLDEYISNLQAFKNLIEQEKTEDLYNSMQETNHISEILNGIVKK